LYAGARDHLSSGGWPVVTLNLTVVDQSVVEILGPGAGDAAGIMPVAGRGVVHGRAAWKKAILRIEIQPNAHVRNHVVAQGHITRAFVQIERNAARNIVDIVLRNQRSWVG